MKHLLLSTLAAIAAATAAFGANIQITSSADDLPLPNRDGSFSENSSRGHSVRHIYYIISEAEYATYTNAASPSEAVYNAFLVGELGEACIFDEIKTNGYSNINLNEIFWYRDDASGQDVNYDKYYGNGTNACFAAIYTYTNKNTGAFYYIAQPTNTVTLTDQELAANPFAHRRITDIAINGGRWEVVEPQSFTVMFFREGGTGGTESVSAVCGIPMPPITIPVREGYAFNGYWTEVDGAGTQYYTATGESARNWDIPSATNLYAYWTEPIAPLPVHRFYSKNYKGHFFTIDEEEKQNLIATNPNWNYEGTAYKAYTNEAPGTVALYRFYSKGYRGHFFTIDADEAETVKTNPNWKYEGIAYYVYPSEVEGSVPVFRFWSKGYRHHFYTTDEAEKDNLIATNPNWNYEGIAFYALPAATVQNGAGRQAAKAFRPSGLSGQSGTSGSQSIDANETAIPEPWLFDAESNEAIEPDAIAETAAGFVLETSSEAPEETEPAIAAGSGGFDGETLRLRLVPSEGACSALLWNPENDDVWEADFAEGELDCNIPVSGGWFWLGILNRDAEPLREIWIRAE